MDHSATQTPAQTDVSAAADDRLHVLTQEELEAVSGGVPFPTVPVLD
jgi:hypothetical protein